MRIRGKTVCLGSGLGFACRLVTSRCLVLERTTKVFAWLPPYGEVLDFLLAVKLWSQIVFVGFSWKGPGWVSPMSLSSEAQVPNRSCHLGSCKGFWISWLPKSTDQSSTPKDLRLGKRESALTGFHHDSLVLSSLIWTKERSSDSFACRRASSS